MNNQTELKPCPFCGNQPLLLEADYDSCMWWEITCKGCGLSTSHDDINDKKKLIEIWNKRIGDEDEQAT